MKPIILTQEAKENALKMFKQLLDKVDADSDLRINITSETLIQQQGIKKPTIFVLSDAYLKMKLLINASDKELAWYGVATRIKDNYFIEDILVYPQTVTSATVDADEEKCAQWFMKLPDKVINNLKFQGHSHVKMSASPSGRDTANWLKFANLLKDDEFYILCIGNKQDEFYWNIYDKAINVHFENNDITMVIVDDKGRSISEWAKKSIDQYIKSEHFITPTVSSYLTTLKNHANANSSDNKHTVFLNNHSYETVSQIKDATKTIKTMLSYIPAEYADEIYYDIDSDMYFTYNTDLPEFYYSSLYDCYACRGDSYRKKHSKVSTAQAKKKTKTNEKGVKKNELK